MFRKNKWIFYKTHTDYKQFSFQSKKKLKKKLMKFGIRCHSVFANRHQFSMKTPTFSRCPNASNSFILIFTPVNSKCFQSKLTTLNPNLHTVLNKKACFSISILKQKSIAIFLKDTLRTLFMLKDCIFSFNQMATEFETDRHYINYQTF
jgi:hypothetical protein